MKKLLFVTGSIAAMIIVSSCSTDSLDDVKNENAINKNKISVDTLKAAPVQLIYDGLDDKDKVKT